MQNEPGARPTPTLRAYGWDDAAELAFVQHRADGTEPERVATVHRGFCDAIAESGPLRLTVGRRDDGADTVCTGDWVAVRSAPDLELVEVLPRRTSVARGSAAATSRPQVLAANVDTVALVFGLDPGPKPALVERFLALAWESGARPVVVLTKADRVRDPRAAVAEVEHLAPGASVLAVSALDGEGLAAVVEALAGTVVLLGPSGAGKSTLGNALLGGTVLATGAVREVDGKGRHTTVTRELLPLPGGGVLIDTPGLRGVGLAGAAEGLHQTFADVEALAESCRFGDCAHETEPGCAVQEAIEAGTLDARRLSSCRKLQRENAWATERGLARQERNRRTKEITRAQRAGYAFRAEHGHR
jgi:ribosome biogenesis GTPase / thiamine phosphate phosphatase